ncbi:thioesterase [Pseudomonas sp. CrR25]|nr:thioesterase [Pseudomonas sp. CrR25]
MTPGSGRVIYAFPHAGASAAVYRPWIKLASAATGAILQPVELPGRGVLGREAEIRALDDLVERLADTISADLRRRQADGAVEWGTFGHSFGGVLSVAVSHALARMHRLTPVVSVVSGSVPPSLQKVDNLHEWTDEQILQKTRDDQATPSAVLAEPAMARRIVAQLRNDFIIRSQFRTLSDMVVEHPLTLVAATLDPHVSAEQMTAWRHHTAKATSFIAIDGDHFAVYRHWDVIEQALTRGATFVQADHHTQGVNNA